MKGSSSMHAKGECPVYAHSGGADTLVFRVCESQFREVCGSSVVTRTAIYSSLSYEGIEINALLVLGCEVLLATSIYNSLLIENVVFGGGSCPWTVATLALALVVVLDVVLDVLQLP
jgi:hypothetical protein